MCEDVIVDDESGDHRTTTNEQGVSGGINNGSMEVDEKVDGQTEEEVDEEIGDGVLEYIRLSMESYSLPHSNDYFHKQRALKQRMDVTGFSSSWSWGFTVALSCVSKQKWDIDEFIGSWAARWAFESGRELTIDGFIEEVEAWMPKAIEVLGNNTKLLEDLHEMIETHKHVPRETSGKAWQCGLRALRDSYNSLMTRRGRAERTTLEELQALLFVSEAEFEVGEPTSEYSAWIDDFLGRKADVHDVQLSRLQLLTVQNFCDDQIQAALQLLDPSLSFGMIVLPKKFSEPARAYLLSFLSDNIVWIVNNNYGGETSNGIGHYQGFGDPNNWDGPQMVRSWGFTFEHLGVNNFASSPTSWPEHDNGFAPGRKEEGGQGEDYDGEESTYGQKDDEEGEDDNEEMADNDNPKSLYHMIQRHEELLNFRLRLAEIQEPDPANYFGDTTPPFGGSRIAVHTLPYEDFPLSFQQVASAMLDPARFEIHPAEVKILGDAIKQKKGFENDEEAVRYHLVKLETRRALYFAKWYRDQLQEQFESCINIYGVQRTSTATCVLFHRGQITVPPTKPAQTLQELINNPTLIHSIFTAGFKSPDGKRAGTKIQAKLYTSIPWRNDTRKVVPTSIVMMRIIAWLSWIEHGSPSLAEQESELHFVSRHSRHCSHTCGQFLCLIHWTFETWQMNLSRDVCKERAKLLRKAGQPVPQFCDIHTPPCFSQLQVLTAGEALDIQFSTLHGTRKTWLDHKTPYSTAENSFPLKLSSRSPYDSTQQRLELYAGEPSSFFEQSRNGPGFGKTPKPRRAHRKDNSVRSDTPVPCPFPSCKIKFAKGLRWNLEFYSHCRQDHIAHPLLPTVVKAYSPKSEQSDLTFFHGLQDGAPLMKTFVNAMSTEAHPNIEYVVGLLQELTKDCPFCKTFYMYFGTQVLKIFDHLKMHFSESTWRGAINEAVPYALRKLGETRQAFRWDKDGSKGAQKRQFCESLLDEKLSDDAILTMINAGYNSFVPAIPSTPPISAAMSRARAERMRAIVEDLMAHCDDVGQATLTDLLRSIKDDDRSSDDYCAWESAFGMVGTEIVASSSEGLWLLRGSSTPTLDPPRPAPVTGAADIVAILSRSQAEGEMEPSTTCYLASCGTDWASVSWKPSTAILSMDVERLVRKLLEDYEAQGPTIEKDKTT